MRPLSGRPGRPLLFTLALALVLPALAIEVTPDSPCAALCIDDSTLDVSDPASSTTANADITCSDADFSTTPAGTKWSACMACLQNSTHAQRGESDQAWFLYNLRYQIDYCIFGYPNASDVIGSSPCQTSTACLPLQAALFTGVPASSSSSGSGAEYDYCSVDGGVLTSDAIKGCRNCISGSGNADIVTNSLIALEAGCIEQRPTNETVGLSGSIFTTGTTISIVAATSTSTSSAASSGGTSHIATTTIVVVAVVAVLIAAAVAGFGFVCYRKRRNAAGRGRAGPLERKTDALASMESGVASQPGNDRKAPDGKTAIGPVDWHTRFPSTEHISGPLNVHGVSPSSHANADDMLGGKAAPPFVGATISRPSSVNSAHSSVVSTHEPQGTAAAAGAPQKTHKKQFQHTSAGNVSTHGTAASAADSNLPAIVESPFPSPAVQDAGAGAVSSLNLRIHSTDFDTHTDYPMASMVTAPPRTRTNMASAPRRHPRLHQLKTSFGDASPDGGSAGSASASTGSYTPSSASGLLWHAAGPGVASASSAPLYTYNPAMYAPSQRSSAHQPSPLHSEPPSAVAVAASPASSTAGGSVEHQLRIASRSLVAQQKAVEQQQQQQQKQQKQQQQQADLAQKLAAANIAHNARKQGGYQGWSAMITSAQQGQVPVPSQHAPVYTSPHAASSSRPASASGIGSSTMATRQVIPSARSSQAGSPLAGPGVGAHAIDLSTTTSPASIPNSATSPASILNGSTHLVRKSKSGPFAAFGRSGTGSEGSSPAETRSIQTNFLPPPHRR